MELQLYIRSKFFTEELKYKLLHIVRGNNHVEGFIDLIKKLEDLVFDESLIDENTYLKEKNRDLEIEVEACEANSERLSELEILFREKKLSANSLENFVEQFKENMKRHPSIDEVWEAAWDNCKKNIKKESDS